MENTSQDRSTQTALKNDPHEKTIYVRGRSNDSGIDIDKLDDSQGEDIDDIRRPPRDDNKGYGQRFSDDEEDEDCSCKSQDNNGELPLCPAKMLNIGLGIKHIITCNPNLEDDFADVGIIFVDTDYDAVVDLKEHFEGWRRPKDNEPVKVSLREDMMGCRSKIGALSCLLERTAFVLLYMSPEFVRSVWGIHESCVTVFESLAQKQQICVIPVYYKPKHPRDDRYSKSWKGVKIPPFLRHFIELTIDPVARSTAKADKFKQSIFDKMDERLQKQNALDAKREWKRMRDENENKQKKIAQEQELEKERNRSRELDKVLETTRRRQREQTLYEKNDPHENKIYVRGRSNDSGIDIDNLDDSCGEDKDDIRRPPEDDNRGYGERSPADNNYNRVLSDESGYGAELDAEEEVEDDSCKSQDNNGELPLCTAKTQNIGLGNKHVLTLNPYLEDDFADVGIIFFDEDYDAVVDLKQHFEGWRRPKDNEPVKVSLREDMISCSSKIGALNCLLKRTTFVLLYMTPEFIRSVWGIHESYETVYESLQNKEIKAENMLKNLSPQQQICVIPVYYKSKHPRDDRYSQAWKEVQIPSFLRHFIELTIDPDGRPTAKSDKFQQSIFDKMDERLQKQHDLDAEREVKRIREENENKLKKIVRERELEKELNRSRELDKELDSTMRRQREMTLNEE